MANVVGIEITSRSVRAAQLRISGRRCEPLRYVEVAITQLGEEGSRATALAGAVRELIDTLDEPPDAVQVALEGRFVSLRSVRIPEAAAKRAAEVLPFELESQLPFPPDEAIIDYQPMSGEDGQLTLLAAAVRPASLEQTLATLLEAGLDPRELPPDGVCLDAVPVPEKSEADVSQPVEEELELEEIDEEEVTSAGPKQAAPQGTSTAQTGAWLVAHVEDDSVELCVLREGVCVMARTVDVGLEAAQHDPALLRTALVQSVSMYRAQGGPALMGVLVSGTGGDQEPFVQWLGKLMQLPARPVFVPAPGGSAAAARFGKAYSLAARSARRGKRLDMRRGPFAFEGSENLLRKHARIILPCVAAIALSYVFSVWAEYRVLAEERDGLADQLEEVSKRRLGEGTRSVTRTQELLKRLDKREDPMPEFDALQTLGAISDAIDMDISHSTRKLEVRLDDGGGDGTFEISGTVPDLAARDGIATALEDHECIRELEKGRTSSVSGKPDKTYTLEGAVGCGPSKKKKKKKKKRRGG